MNRYPDYRGGGITRLPHYGLGGFFKGLGGGIFDLLKDVGPQALSYMNPYIGIPAGILKDKLEGKSWKQSLVGGAKNLMFDQALKAGMAKAADKKDALGGWRPDEGDWGYSEATGEILEKGVNPYTGEMMPEVASLGWRDFINDPSTALDVFRGGVKEYIDPKNRNLLTLIGSLDNQTQADILNQFGRMNPDIIMPATGGGEGRTGSAREIYPSTAQYYGNRDRADGGIIPGYGDGGKHTELFTRPLPLPGLSELEEFDRLHFEKKEESDELEKFLGRQGYADSLVEMVNGGILPGYENGGEYDEPNGNGDRTPSYYTAAERARQKAEYEAQQQARRDAEAAKAEEARARAEAEKARLEALRTSAPATMSNGPEGNGGNGGGGGGGNGNGNGNENTNGNGNGNGNGGGTRNRPEPEKDPYGPPLGPNPTQAQIDERQRLIDEEIRRQAQEPDPTEADPVGGDPPDPDASGEPPDQFKDEKGEKPDPYEFKFTGPSGHGRYMGSGYEYPTFRKPIMPETTRRKPGGEGSYTPDAEGYRAGFMPETARTTGGSIEHGADPFAPLGSPEAGSRYADLVNRLEQPIDRSVVDPKTKIPDPTFHPPSFDPRFSGPSDAQLIGEPIPRESDRKILGPSGLDRSLPPPPPGFKGGRGGGPSPDDEEPLINLEPSRPVAGRGGPDPHTSPPGYQEGGMTGTMPPELMEIVREALMNPSMESNEILQILAQQYPQEMAAMIQQVRGTQQMNTGGIVTKGYIPEFADGGMESSGAVDDRVAVSKDDLVEEDFQDRLENGGPVDVVAALAPNEFIITANQTLKSDPEDMVQAAEAIPPDTPPGEEVWNSFTDNLDRVI